MSERIFILQHRIYYPSGKLHIGSGLQTIACDVLLPQTPHGLRCLLSDRILMSMVRKSSKAEETGITPSSC